MSEYNMYNYNKYKPTNRETEFIGNLINITPNDISYIFFSDNNIIDLNKRLIEQVKNTTFERYGKKIIIESQNKHIMLTIMRHIYFRNCKNQYETNIEVEMLNKEVLKEIIPTILNGILSQIRYINDYNTIHTFDLPKSGNSKKLDTIKPLSSLFGDIYS